MKPLVAAMMLAGAWAVACALLALLQRVAQPLQPPSPAGRLLLWAGVFLVLTVWGWQREILVPYGAGRARSEYLLTGDEPDYLLTALSLARDGDFDVHNNIVQRDHLSFQNRPIGGAEFEVFNRIAKGRLESGRAQWGEAQYTPHRPGTSVVLSPVFLLAAGNFRWWFRRYHPLFGWPPLAGFYDLLPDLPDAAPLLEWGKAACWLVVALLPCIVVSCGAKGAGRNHTRAETRR